MSDQPSFELGDESGSESAGDKAAPRPVNDAVVDTGEDTGVNHDDRKPFPSGVELRATVCRAVWDAAEALEPLERAWIAEQRSHGDTVATPHLEYNLTRLPTLNGEGMQLFSQREHAVNGVEVARDRDRDRSVQLERSWSPDPSVTPHTDGAASIYRWQRYDFAGPNHCHSVWTTVSVYFDPDHSIDALNDFFEVLQTHGANFELELEKTTSFVVLQKRVPSPEELLHLAKDRLQPDVNWQRHAITKPWPGFMTSAEQVVDHAAIILSELFGAACT